MATEKVSYENADRHSSSSSNHERPEESKERPGIEPFRMGKALAHRALYGPDMSRRGKSRKLRNQDIKTSPSRLSKVSLADETADAP